MKGTIEELRKEKELLQQQVDESGRALEVCAIEHQYDLIYDGLKKMKRLRVVSNKLLKLRIKEVEKLLKKTNKNSILNRLSMYSFKSRYFISAGFLLTIYCGASILIRPDEAYGYGLICLVGICFLMFLDVITD